MLSAVVRRAKGVTASPLRLTVVAVLIGAAVAFGAVAEIRSSGQTTNNTGQQGIQGPPRASVAAPLPPPAQQVTMADAATAFGSQVTLPNTSALQPADVGPVWDSVGPGQATVAVTFPSQGIFIDYIKPAPYSDPASGLQAMSQGFPASKVVQLNGTTPALYIPQNSDDTGASPGVVLFETNGAEIRIVGHNDEPTLEAIAQSILARSNS